MAVRALVFGVFGTNRRLALGGRGAFNALHVMTLGDLLAERSQDLPVDDLRELLKRPSKLGEARLSERALRVALESG
jgi:hypothetical protein